MRRVVLTGGVVALVAAACVVNRDALADTGRRLAALSPTGAAMMAGCALLIVLTRAVTLSIATPGLGIGRAVAADQAHVGATNGVVVGGGAVGTAAKVAMLRSWGVRPHTAGASVVATAVTPGLVTWGLAATIHLPAVLGGRASWPETVATLSGAVLVIGATAFWAVVLVHPTPSAIAGRLASRVHRGVRRRVPERWSRVHGLLQGLDPDRFTEELRRELLALVRRRGTVLLLACVGYAGALYMTLWCALAATGVSGVGMVEALSVLTMVRVLVAVSPVPGGIGVAELGLVTMLADAGADRAGAATAAVVFRATTWLLPMVLGATGWAWWRRQVRSVLAAEQVALEERPLEPV